MVSVMTGTSGRCRERSLLLMPSGFTLSEPANGMSSTGVAEIICTLPANMSVNAWATGFTPPAVLPPSQMIASVYPMAWRYLEVEKQFGIRLEPEG